MIDFKQALKDMGYTPYMVDTIDVPWDENYYPLKPGDQVIRSDGPDADQWWSPSAGWCFSKPHHTGDVFPRDIHRRLRPGLVKILVRDE